MQRSHFDRLTSATSRFVDDSSSDRPSAATDTANASSADGSWSRERSSAEDRLESAGWCTDVEAGGGRDEREG